MTAATARDHLEPLLADLGAFHARLQQNGGLASAEDIAVALGRAHELSMVLSAIVLELCRERDALRIAPPTSGRLS
jgi:hypothetical protein